MKPKIITFLNANKGQMLEAYNAPEPAKGLHLTQRILVSKAVTEVGFAPKSHPDLIWATLVAHYEEFL